MKTSLKKFIALCIAAFMVLASTACSGSKNGAVKNVIIIIGDGMGLEQIAAGELVSEKDFSFTNWQRTSVNTDSVNTNGIAPVLTDSAAGGTALATGNLTVNGYVGKNFNGEDVETILDRAKKDHGKATGVVTTDTLYGATPSAFSAHSKSRDNSDEIIQSQIESDVDLLCGTTDSKCVFKQLDIIAAGYNYCDDIANVGECMSADKTYWQFDMAGTDADVELKDAAVNALDYLDQDEDGFVLMIEQAHIDKYSHSNDFEGMAKSAVSLNDTVEAILEWLGNRNDTAIVITADHETGGLTVGGQSYYPKTYETEDGRTVYYKWSTTSHTNSKVGAFVYGYEADFSKYDYYSSEHLIKNTDVYRLMLDMLNGSE